MNYPGTDKQVIISAGHLQFGPQIFKSLKNNIFVFLPENRHRKEEAKLTSLLGNNSTRFHLRATEILKRDSIIFTFGLSYFFQINAIQKPELPLEKSDTTSEHHTSRCILQELPIEPLLCLKVRNVTNINFPGGIE